MDASRLPRLHELGVPVLFGDAANSEILRHAALPAARALVVTVPDDAAALVIVTAARRLAPDLRIVSRASTWEGARRMRDAGAQAIVRPELEGGIEIVRQTLLGLDFPPPDVQRYADAVRHEGLETAGAASDRARAVADLAHALGDLDIGWLLAEEGCSVAGRTIATSQLRSRTGASIVAIGRGHTLISNPGPAEILRARRSSGCHRIGRTGGDRVEGVRGRDGD